MLTAKIVITVQYPEGVGMEDAEDDKAEFLHEIKVRNFPTVAVDGIAVDYTIAEVDSTHSPEPANVKHNHFGEMFKPDTCPACRGLQRNID